MQQAVDVVQVDSLTKRLQWIMHQQTMLDNNGKLISDNKPSRNLTFEEVRWNAEMVEAEAMAIAAAATVVSFFTGIKSVETNLM